MPTEAVQVRRLQMAKCTAHKCRHAPCLSPALCCIIPSTRITPPNKTQNGKTQRLRTN